MGETSNMHLHVHVHIITALLRAVILSYVYLRLERANTVLSQFALQYCGFEWVEWERKIEALGVDAA